MSLPDNIEESHRMIEELRKENAKRRVDAKQYSVFDDYLPAERDFLLDLIADTSKDPAKGAIGFRDLALRMMGHDTEKFLAGTDITVPAPAEEESEETEESAKLGDDAQEEIATMKPEDIAALLDEREAKAAEKAAEAKREAEIEAVFTEIEELGFPRGSEGFLGMLSLAQVQAKSGKEPVFTELADKVIVALGIEDPRPKPEGEATEGEGEEAPAEETTEETDPKFVSTGDVQGVGAPAEPKSDWVAEAKAEGKDLMQVARERAEARV